MKIDHAQAYVLHYRSYRETSLLLDVFSRDYGRLGLVAKGMKHNKKYGGVDYSLYQRHLISWVSKTELGTLTNIERDSKTNLLTPEQAMLGFYLNEIVTRLLHQHEPHPELFDAYEHALERLANNEPEGISLRYFEKALLQILGYGLVLDCDVISGENIKPEIDYFYYLEQGPSQIEKKGQSPLKISGQTLLDLNKESLNQPANIKEARVLLQLILQRYLGDKPLASRKLYQAYVRTKKVV